MIKNPDITLEELKSLLFYDPIKGIFTWIKDNRMAGSIKSNGYYAIKIKRKSYYAHRLAWFYSYDVWPVNFIDHKNHNPLDYRLSNLREATRANNKQNSRIQKNNKYQIKGVSFENGKWRAQINDNNKKIHLGVFLTMEEAATAYQIAAEKIFGEFYCVKSQQQQYRESWI
jgi:hypothetical protein